MLNSTYNFRSIDKGSTGPFVYTSKTWKTAVYIIVALGRCRDGNNTLWQSVKRAWETPTPTPARLPDRHYYRGAPYSSGVALNSQQKVVNGKLEFGCCDFFSLKGKYETKI